MRTMVSYAESLSELVPPSKKADVYLEKLGQLKAKFKEQFPKEEQRKSPHVENDFVKDEARPFLEAAGDWPESRWIEPVLVPIAFLYAKLYGLYTAIQLCVLIVCLSIMWLMGIPASTKTVIHATGMVFVPSVIGVGLLGFAMIVLAICPRGLLPQPFDLDFQVMSPLPRPQDHSL